MKSFYNLVMAGIIFLLAVTLVSCGGGSGGGGTTGLRIGLTDAPGDYMHVFVTINEIQVHQSAGEVGDDDPGWLTVLTPGKTYDLKALQNGVITNLGLTELVAAGHYTQMRLILAGEAIPPHPFANYVVIDGDQEEEYVIGQEGAYSVEELKVPSGLQTGIKIVQGVDIVSGEVTDVILDFDANRSVVQAGKSGKWILKPTIKVLETVNNSVSGTVDAGEDNWLENISVSAQKYDAGAADLKDAVTVAGSSASNILGDYFMYLPPDTYNIVAAGAGYLPYCQEIDATVFGPHPGVDFTLTGAAVGSVTGTVTGLADGAFATLSFRQTVDCENGGTGVQVEILSRNIAAGSSYDVSLSAGNYQLVVSAADKTTLQYPVAVADGVPTTQDISF